MESGGWGGGGGNQTAAGGPGNADGDGVGSFQRSLRLALGAHPVFDRRQTAASAVPMFGSSGLELQVAVRVFVKEYGHGTGYNVLKEGESTEIAGKGLGASPMPFHILSGIRCGRFWSCWCRGKTQRTMHGGT